MSNRATGKVWEYTPLEATTRQLLALLAIADYAHDDGTYCYARQSSLACKLRYKDTRTFRKVLTELEELVYVVNHGQIGPAKDPKYRPNMIDLVFQDGSNWDVILERCEFYGTAPPVRPTAWASSVYAKGGMNVPPSTVQGGPNGPPSIAQGGPNGPPQGGPNGPPSVVGPYGPTTTTTTLKNITNPSKVKNLNSEDFLPDRVVSKFELLQMLREKLRTRKNAPVQSKRFDRKFEPILDLAQASGLFLEFIESINKWDHDFINWYILLDYLMAGFDEWKAMRLPWEDEAPKVVIEEEEDPVITWKGLTAPKSVIEIAKQRSREAGHVVDD